jgi:DNA mismatch endonuclease, patch repair protein
MDVLTPEQRSHNMRSIRSRGNASTELAVAAELRRHRLSGWRRHMPLPGRPDFYFPTQRLAIFVHGCYWHGCSRCGAGRLPTTNREYWREKILTNRRRDERVRRRLRRAGIGTMVIWEHEVRRGTSWLGRLGRRLSAGRAR